MTKLELNFIEIFIVFNDGDVCIFQEFSVGGTKLMIMI